MIATATARPLADTFRQTLLRLAGLARPAGPASREEKLNALAAAERPEVAYDLGATDLRHPVMVQPARAHAHMLAFLILFNGHA